jgi:hypothetical protein
MDGDRSYSLFLLHRRLPARRDLGRPSSPRPNCGLLISSRPPVLSLIASDLSYRIAERPYSGRKQEADQGLTRTWLRQLSHIDLPPSSYRPPLKPGAARQQHIHGGNDLEVLIAALAI